MRMRRRRRATVGVWTCGEAGAAALAVLLGGLMDFVGFRKTVSEGSGS